VLARSHAADAIAALVEIMADRNAPPSARVAAAVAMLDRGYGRPPQSLDVTQRLTLAEEFESFVRSLRADQVRS
jgi:hypothetical protein